MNAPGTRLLRLASRHLPSTVVASLVAPTVADMQWEFDAACRQGDRQARYAALVRGYGSLLRLLPVLMMHAIGAVTHAWVHEDDHAMPRVVSYTVAAVLCCTALLMLPPSGGFQRMTPALLPWCLLLLIPQALGVALPVGFLIGSLIGLRGRARTGRTLRRLLIGSVAVLLLTLATLQVMPATNQAFRQTVMSDLVARGVLPTAVHLEKGPNERSLGELRDRIHRASLNLEDVKAVQALQYAFHVRLAIILSPLTMAVMAFGVVSVGRQRWSAVLAGIVLAVAVVLLIWDDGFAQGWSPVLRAYLPDVIFAIVGLGLLWCSLGRGERRAAPLQNR